MKPPALSFQLFKQLRNPDWALSGALQIFFLIGRYVTRGASMR